MPPKDKIIEPIHGTFDNVINAVLDPENVIEQPKILQSPFAQWRGKIELGDDELDCYVLDTKQRVISLRGTIKSIANVESSSLADYIGASAVKPFINKDKILAELIEFSIPGTPCHQDGGRRDDRNNRLYLSFFRYYSDGSNITGYCSTKKAFVKNKAS